MTLSAIADTVSTVSEVSEYNVWWPLAPEQAMNNWQAFHSQVFVPFRQVGQFGWTLRYERHYTTWAWWVYVLCVILFPIGLLFLLVNEKHLDVLTLIFTSGHGGTWLVCTGNIALVYQQRLTQTAQAYASQLPTTQPAHPPTTELPSPEQPRVPPPS
jgi:hypothetical protein